MTSGFGRDDFEFERDEVFVVTEIGDVNNFNKARSIYFSLYAFFKYLIW